MAENRPNKGKSHKFSLPSTDGRNAGALGQVAALQRLYARLARYDFVTCDYEADLPHIKAVKGDANITLVSPNGDSYAMFMLFAGEVEDEKDREFQRVNDMTLEDAVKFVKVLDETQ